MNDNNPLISGYTLQAYRTVRGDFGSQQAWGLT